MNFLWLKRAFLAIDEFLLVVRTEFRILIDVNQRLTQVYYFFRKSSPPNNFFFNGSKEKAKRERTMTAKEETASKATMDDKKEKTKEDSKTAVGPTKPAASPKTKYRRKPRAKTPGSVGKFDPKRDLSIFFVVSLAFTYFAYHSYKAERLHHEKYKDMYKDMDKRSPREKLVDAYGKLLEDMEKTANEFDCNAVLHLSNLPRDTIPPMSLYAGRDYQPGDTILDLGPKIFPLQGQNDNDSIWVPPLALVMKHHPIKYNIIADQDLSSATENIDGSVVLKATKVIPKGQELYFNPKSFPSELNEINQSPYLEDYKQADEIIREAVHTLIGKKEVTNISKKQEYTLHMGLELSKRVTAKLVSPIVTSLMPKFPLGLLDYQSEDASTVELALTKNDYALMTYDGQCLSNVEKSKEESFLVASKSIEEGKKIMPIPLFVTSFNNSVTECSPSGDMEKFVYNNCLGRSKVTSLVLCPLSQQNIAVAKTPEEANAVYKWNLRSQMREKVNPASTVKNHSVGHLGWDVTALKDINPGEPILVYLEQEEGMLQIPQDLIPKIWEYGSSKTSKKKKPKKEKPNEKPKTQKRTSKKTR